MINCVIVEDEAHSAQTLKTCIGNYCQSVHVLAVFTCAEEAILALPKLKPDILFLDIMLGDMNGFELLDKCQLTDTQIIFTTAYDSYALRAIKSSAVDYLLKPINIEELRSAVQLAEVNLSKSSRNSLEALMLNYKNRFEHLERIAFPTFEGHSFADVKTIVRFEADGSYTTMFLDNGQKHLISKPLKDYEQLLANDGFFRVHYSHLINLGHIKKYIRGNGGSIILSDNSMVDVAARRKDAFLKAIHVI
jgi:two-component system LytT family response regulator